MAINFSQILPLLLNLMVQSAMAQTEITLNVFIQMVESRNLELKIQKTDEAAAQAESEGVRLPAPELHFSTMNMSGESSSGIGISQGVPNPLRVHFNHSARHYQALRLRELRRLKEVELRAVAKAFFFNLWGSQERLRHLSEKAEVLRNHLKLARSAVRSDTSLKLHLLSTESDLDLLENELFQEESRLSDLNSQISVILADAKMVSFKAVTTGPSKVPSLNSIDHHPQVLAASQEVLSASENLKAAQAAWLPDFNLKYMEEQRLPMDEPIKELSLGVTLPFLFFWQPRSEIRQASQAKIKAELQRDLKGLEIEGQRRRLLANIHGLNEQLSVLTQRLIPRAENRIRIVQNISPRDLESLKDHRATMEALPDLKLKMTNLRVDFETAIAAAEVFIDKGGPH